MPKVRRNRSISLGNARASPLVCSESPTDKEIKYWEKIKYWDEVCCPGCLDPPHNAILLVCSSFGNGCRPYMCGTSIRHSNCFVQFLKTSQKKFLSNLAVASLGEEVDNDQGGALRRLKLKCPLCRGDVLRWLVVKDARRYMNLKTRTCSVDRCEDTGTFYDLRIHALLSHGEERPSEGDPERHAEWSRLEHQRASGDILSAIQAQWDQSPQLHHGHSQIVFPGQDLSHHLVAIGVPIQIINPWTPRRDYRLMAGAIRSTPPSRDEIANRFWDRRSGPTRSAREIIYISDDEE